MAVPNPFVQHLIDQMDSFGLVEAKPMFGGFGLYHKGLMFGLVAEDTLYLKVDDGNRPRFEAAGCRPFVYQGKGGSGPVGMSYFRATDEALEDPEELADWARSGYEAALRAKNGKGGGGGGAGRRPPGRGGRQNGSRPPHEVGPMQPRSPLQGPGGVPIQMQQSQGQSQGQGQGQDQQRTGQRPGRRSRRRRSGAASAAARGPRPR